MQERSHAFAMKSQIWLLDPRPNLESMVKAVEDGFSLSEASKTPVMLQLRIRGCHVHGRFIAKENKRPPSAWRRRWKARRATPAASCCRRVLPARAGKDQDRWPAAIRYIKEHKLNEHFDGDQSDIGLILQGGLYNGVMRALQLLGLADHFGNSRIPLYVMNVTYPSSRTRSSTSAATSAPCCCWRKASPTTSSRTCTRCCARPASPRSCRAGRAADGRRVHHPGHARGPARIPAPQPPRIAADASGRGGRRSRRQHRPAEIVEIARARPAKPVEQPITFHKHVEGWRRWCRRARPASVPAAPSARSSRR